MNPDNSLRAGLCILGGVCLLLAAQFSSAASDPEALLIKLDAYPHAQRISYSKTEVIDHEIGLGAMQKIRGDWRFKDSERLSGTLVSYTWQIVDGYTSAQVMEKLLDEVQQGETASLLFSCEGRECGNGAEWANRVFNERVLYGRADMQRYAVYTIKGDPEYRLVTYSSARTEDRQYLRADLLLVGK
jgi:hypothetical protein